MVQSGLLKWPSCLFLKIYTMYFFFFFFIPQQRTMNNQKYCIELNPKMPKRVHKWPLLLFHERCSLFFCIFYMKLDCHDYSKLLYIQWFEINLFSYCQFLLFLMKMGNLMFSEVLNFGFCWVLSTWNLIYQQKLAYFGHFAFCNLAFYWGPVRLSFIFL